MFHQGFEQLKPIRWCQSEGAADVGRGCRCSARSWSGFYWLILLSDNGRRCCGCRNLTCERFYSQPSSSHLLPSSRRASVWDGSAENWTICSVLSAWLGPIRSDLVPHWACQLTLCVFFCGAQTCCVSAEWADERSFSSWTSCCWWAGKAGGRYEGEKVQLES